MGLIGFYIRMIDFTDIAEQIKKGIADEWQSQGHDLTGKFREGMTYQIKNTADSTFIFILDNTDSGYGKIINEGVRADQIKYPYARARIRGLTMYAKLRMGASDKDAVSIAFAIATKHAKEGMPLPSSKRFSKTGNRTHFVEDAEKRFKKIIENSIAKQLEWQS